MSNNIDRKIIITVDTEALPLRAPSDHVDRLIWGRFPEVEMGIGRMMEIANRHSVSLTFFVDLCESLLYPNSLKSVCSKILGEGHDLQLHAHPHIMPSSFATKYGLSTSGGHLQTRDKADLLIEFLVNTAWDLARVEPVAFRGGAFAYNDSILSAMIKNGIDLSFNYSIASKYQSNNKENLPVFRWNNGAVEMPMSFLRFNGNMQPFEFGPTSRLCFSNLNNVHCFMNCYFEEFGDDSVLVLLMHSWSLLSFDNNSGYFFFKDNCLCEQFDNFLFSIKNNFNVLTATTLHDLVKKKIINPKLIRNVDLANFNKYGF